MFEPELDPRLPAAPDPQLAAPGEALRDYAVAELDSAVAGLRWRGARIHAGVHQARKALRRVRATLALGGAALGPGAALVDREIRSVNHGLSALRDAQALVETLQRLIAKQADVQVLRMLRRASRVAVARRAADARAALADEPTLVARQDLLAALRGAMLALPWQRLALPQLWTALAESGERISKAQARARQADNDNRWHRWRRRVRRLSQQWRALNAAGIAPATHLPTVDKRLAKQLGEAQDLSLLREHCGPDSLFVKPERTRLLRYAATERARRRRTIAAQDNA